MKKLIFLFFLLILAKSGFAQSDDLQIGSNYNKLTQPPGAFFDYSDPEAVNIKVAVWGQVRYPGKYIVPSYTTLNDLISYSGGPTQDANLDDLRLFRIEKDSTQSLFKFNYNDLLWNRSVDKIKLDNIPTIKAGDILLVPGEPRLFFRDYLTLALTVISTLASLVILLINLKK